MPAFPQPFTSTVSHWQATNRGPTSLWNHGRDAPLPTKADIVIVGAGVTGSSLAYHLTRPGDVGEGKRIIVLEAKDVASGASGRNGGHVGPRAWDGFGSLTRSRAEGGAGLTNDDALDIMYFEADNLDYVESLVKKEKLNVDFWRGNRCDVLTTEASVQANLANIETYKKTAAASTKHNGRQTEWELISDPREARKVSRIKSALAINRGPSGSWHPHRGTTALLRLAIESKTSTCEFFSWTPVNSVTPSPSGWSVDCGGRGTIVAGQVVLATNAWTSHLFPNVPDLANHVIPYRGQAALITPPTTYAGTGALEATMGIERGPYLIQTPHSGLVIGPYNATVLSEFGTPKDLFYIEDDSVVTPKFHDWLSTYCKDNFEGWGKEVKGEGNNHDWSGIMAHSIDWVPLVGPVPDMPGLWVSAGYNGHGMAKIITITRSIAQHMKTGKWDPRMPQCFAITKERLRAAKQCKPVIPLQSRL
ncbi:uncharacterized protein EHS24_004246 [Apiotrichum porosum]|uniref:FAD dependent oxidoreductase domain-containing protein n=1 Tax=Apiotrichum porosum TaxID=105984 RepID=A0A427Y4N8_9TREE|nr:uncharacterized protein EHS24_004246 [Apiotrichum porosum]RSH86042.1 hypothetical protein EHS24_004246 [Apiotrichum porosum]